MKTREDKHKDATEYTHKAEKQHYWSWFVVAITAAVCRIPDFYFPMNRDSGLFAYGGWRILHGALPYTDFFDNKLPGVFYINALAIQLFGPTTQGLVIFQMIYVAITACVFFAIARRLCSFRASLVISLLFAFYHGSYGLSDGGNYTETYIALPALLGLLLLLKWSDHRTGLLAPFAAGALVAVSALIKQPAASLAGAMVLFLLLGDHRKRGYAPALAVIAGAAAVAGLTVVWMALSGILKDAIDANLVFNRLYFDDSYTYGIKRMPWNVLRGLNMVALPVFGAIGGIISLRLRRTSAAGAAWLLIPWFILDLFGLAMGGRFYTHYFIAILPSAFLLTGVLIDAAVRSTKSALIVAAAGLILFCGPIWKMENTSDLVLAGSPVCSIAERQYYALYWIMTRRIPKPHEAMLPAEMIADWIEQNTSESDMIYVWGWDTRIAFLSQRALPSRYLHTHPLGATGFNRDKRIQELADSIEKHRPAYIVDTSPLMPTTAPPLDPTAPKAPQFSPFFRLDGYEPVQDVVARHYRLVTVISGCPIYEAK
ncbi:MAG TPA: glycosyltransferase family 39 protein [Armatimonadota bacterium]|nr:glycosyltransferase family 39 protein [Armatimonadota bacterium]